MIILDWEMYIMAKGIIWDRKRIPESMITIKNIKTYNQYAREAITYSRQRFEALAAKMRRKAAALPGQLISSRYYGPLTGLSGEVMHSKRKVGFWFWQTNGPTYQEEYQNYCAKMEAEIEEQTTAGHARQVKLMKEELEKVQRIAGYILEPYGTIPDTYITVTIQNPLKKKKHISTTVNMQEYQDANRETYLDLIGQLNHPGQEDQNQIRHL